MRYLTRHPHQKQLAPDGLQEDELVRGRRIGKQFGSHSLEDCHSYEVVDYPSRYGVSLLVFLPPSLDSLHVRLALRVHRGLSIGTHSSRHSSYRSVVRQGLALDTRHVVGD